MKLIKINSGNVQIKTDAEQLNSLKINDLLLLSDAKTSIVCIVTSITGNDTLNIYDYDSELLGQTEENNTIDCGILGSIRGGIFSKSIDIYPTTQVDISVISESLFREISGAGDSGLEFGSFVNYDTPAVIDGNKFFQRHSAIVGSTGSGKSYTVSMLLEKLSKLKGGNTVVFDLHGEYSGLSYIKSVKIGSGGLSFPVWFLPFRDMYSSLLRIKDESATMQLAALRKAYYKARKCDRSENLPIQYSVNDIVCALKAENEDVIYTGEVYKTGDRAGQPKTVKGENNGKLNSVIALLEDKIMDSRYSFMFSGEQQDYLNYFVNEILGNTDNTVKVIDFSGIPHDMIPTVVAVITKLIYNIQLQQTQQDKSQITPLNIVCEEAHVYIPSSDFGIGASQRRLLEVFETIAKEGRKFGTSLCIISQRPSELNKTIMAQCANFIVLKITNEADQSIIKSILPESSRSIIGMLSLFSPGDCFVIGDSVNITFKAHFDLPKEPPNSNTIDVWDRWQKLRTINTDMLINKMLKN